MHGDLVEITSLSLYMVPLLGLGGQVAGPIAALAGAAWGASNCQDLWMKIF
jgi:hypothetical protein